jgi:hypothetical protein
MSKEALRNLRDADTQSPIGREILNHLLGQHEPAIPPHLDDGYDPMMPSTSPAPFIRKDK